MLEMSNPVPRIAVDAMGGDHGPEVVVPGALMAARKIGLAVKLVGQREAVEQVLVNEDVDDLDLEVVHAEEVAAMGDKPSHILRRKKQTSIQICCNLIKDGLADGLVSAGHTGVTLGCGMFTLGRIKGIERPGLVAFIPRQEKPLVLIDVGANVDCKPRQLVQFAVMADVVAKKNLQIEEPRVGVLSIGEEQGKGNVQVKEAYELLKKTSLNFIGNVEGRDLFEDGLDIAVCDGFVGNIVLKLCEGLGKAFGSLLMSELKKGFFSRLGSLLSFPAFKRFMRRLDYEEYGGAPLLGLNGAVFVCHGSSGKKAIYKAVAMAADFVSSRANAEIRQGLEKNPEIIRFHRLKHILQPSYQSSPSQSADSKEKE